MSEVYTVLAFKDIESSNALYENLPTQYTDTFSGEKFENFIGIILILFLTLSLKTYVVGPR